MNDPTEKKTGSENADPFLTRQLRNSSAYIDDDGFTERVMAALPHGLPRKQENLIISLVLLLASLLVMAIFPWAKIAGLVWEWSLTTNYIDLLQPAIGVTGIIFAACAFWLLRQLRSL